MPSFAATVEREASALCAAHALRSRVLSANDLLLIAEQYALRFRLDRDGVSLTYVDEDGEGLKGYDLFGFLWRKRRAQLRFSESKPTPEDEVRAEVAALIGHLVVAGKDILNGEKSWQGNYGVEPFSVSELTPILVSESPP